MAVPKQRIKEGVGKFLSTISTEMWKTYDDMVDVVRLKIQDGLVEGWKKVETLFKVESVCLAVSAGDELLRRSSDIQSSLAKSSDVQLIHLALVMILSLSDALGVCSVLYGLSIH